MATVAVIGGGISGLCAAHYLSKASQLKILLLESTNRLGGWMSTLHLEDGSLFERGPRSIRGVGVAGLNTLLLVDELGLADRILPVRPSHVAAKNRFIYVDGKLHALPNSLKSLLLPSAPFTKPLLFYGISELFQSRADERDETVDSFFQRRFGCEVARFMANPLCRGVFAGDSSALSMRSCFPIFHNLEQNFKSITIGSLLRKKEGESELVRRYRREKWSMWSFDSGLQTLPDQLARRLRSNNNVDVRTDTTCTQLQFTPDKVKVHLTNKESLTVDHVICALPAFKIPRNDVSFVCKVMMGGAWFTQCFGDVDSCDVQYIVDTALSIVSNQLHIHDQPAAVIPHILKNCIPQYRVGHHSILRQISEYIIQHGLSDQLCLSGASYNGVSVNDCIYNARCDVNRLLEALHMRAPAAT